MTLVLAFSLGAVLAAVLAQIIASRRVTRRKQDAQASIRFWRHQCFRHARAEAALHHKLRELRDEQFDKLVIDAEPEPNERLREA